MRFFPLCAALLALPAGSALAQAQPGKLTYGSAGNGTSGHLAGEQLKIAAPEKGLQLAGRT